MWTERDIKAQADNEQTFYRGKLLENTNGILEFSTFETEGVYGDPELNLRSRVRGSNQQNYDVEITLFFDDNEELEDVEYYCPCIAFSSYNGICKHCVATMLYYMHNQEKSVSTPFSEPVSFENTAAKNSSSANLSAASRTENAYTEPFSKHRTDNSMQQILQRFGNQENWMITDGSLMGKIHLEPTLHLDYNNTSVSLRIGKDKMYVVKNIPELVQHVMHTEMHSYGKQLAFVHQLNAFDENSRGLMEFFIRQFQDYNYWYSTDIRNFTLKNELLDAFFDTISETGTLVDPSVKKQELWYPTTETYQKNLQITAVEDGINLSLEPVPSIASRDWNYIFKDYKIYRTSRRTHEAINLFEDRMTGWCRGESFIAESDLPLFTREMLPELEKSYHVTMDRFSPETYLPDEVSFRLYLDLPQKDIITCDLVADYGTDREYHVFHSDKIRQNRYIREEAKVASLISGYCNAMDDLTGLPAIAEDDGMIYEFLTRGLMECEAVADVYISDQLKKIQVIQPPKVSLGVSLNGNLLDFDLESEGMNLEQLAFLLSKYDRKKNFYRLKSGQFVSMEEGSLDTLAQLQQGLMLTEQQLASGHISLPKFRALYLDAQLRDDESVPVNKSHEFRELIRNMRTVEDSDFEVPEKYVKILRKYQKEGYLWLETLHANGFGGILADDMGLGKTLQVIVFLYAHYIEMAQTSANTLIVCPASLVYNWAQECQQFAPELPVFTVAGTASERKALLASASDGKGRIFITSYDLLRRDIELYQAISFDYQIIDEAQFIKNATTKAAQAVKQIDSRFRLALTGTPVENRLGELWSIFDYLMPGYLFSYSRFREELELPIMQQNDEDALHRIQKMIAPFILRRLKKDVLKDLPDKLEKNMYAPMEGEQKELYQAHVQRLQMLLSKQSPEEFNHSKLQILSELTRLRQLCCDPSLLYENYSAGSSKLDLCINLIQNATEAGHKILVFSQFTTMLDCIADRLKKADIPFFLLTGSTSKQERIRLVTEFNEGDTPVFLISLKAGGTGLNLTAADIVIHYDPWWNTAVQNQATDRAHRIGQKNRVLVYKLIAKNSIEENIIKLQEQKAELAEQILSGDMLGNPSFSKEELLELLQL